MALRFCDSFDHYATADFLAKYQTVAGSPTISAGNGRNGTASMRNPNASAGVTRVIDAQGTWIVGLAYRTTSLVSANILIALMDGATLHVDLRVSAAQKLIVTRNGTLLGTCSTTLVENAWYYIEFKCNISDTVGAPAVMVNGIAETITWATGTSTTQDTRNGGNASADRVRIATGGASATQTVDYEDLYVCDGTGSTNNDFLGDVRVEATFPNGNGNSSQLVGSDGNSTDNYLLVDEAAPATADYVESSTPGDKDTYAFGNLTATSGTVYGVQILPYAAKTDAGSRSIVSVARLSGTETDGAVQTLSATPAYGPSIRETKPGGGAWSIANFNSSEFGAKVNA